MVNILRMKKVINQTCNGHCTRCGQCCNAWNPITLGEYFTIKSYINENNIKPSLCRPKDNNLYITCPFNTGHGCSIYPVRPEVCKQFSCHLDEQTIDKNRTYFDSRADINGNHRDRFIPFDLLFFGDPMTAIMITYKELHADNNQKMIDTLKKLGGDQDFLQDWNLPNCYEIAEAMEKGNIKMEWSEEDESK